MTRAVNVAPGTLDRRRFLTATATAAGGLLIGFTLPSRGTAQQSAGPANLNAFVRIGADDVVTLIIHKPENGQGTVTSLSMLLAEELECDWERIRWEFAPIDRVYGFPLQGTFGSMGVRTSWQPLSQAGATARQMLVRAAADRWTVAPSDCRAENGTVLNVATGAHFTYGELAAAAATLPVPENVALKPASERRLIGTPTKRLDTPLKVTGRATYGIDVRVEDMAFAVVARPPVPGGRVASFAEGAARNVPGVIDVVEIPEGVAVVAENTWAAMEGRKALEITWDDGPNANLSSRGIREMLAALADQPGAVARDQGDAASALESAAVRIAAVYEAPYLAHAPMEPPNTTADVRRDRAELWSGSQIPGLAHGNAVTASGLDASQVRFHTMYIGGGFGSRGGGPVYTEAVAISKAIGRPVNLVYSREDDIEHDRFRPASYARLEAALDAEGWPTAWTGRVACQSFVGLQNGVDREGVAGLADIHYAIPNVHVEYHPPQIDVPTNYWRSVGHSQNTYFAEAFLDELAAASGKDPVAFRRRLLADDPRLLGVLDLAAERSGWNSPPPAGRTRGVAVTNCFGSYNAQVAEVSIENGRVRVHRVTCAIDCGQVVNPAGVVQQMQSGIVYGLSAALKGEITLDRGRVQQTNFHQYDVLRMDEMPAVDVHIVASDQAPGGIGEVGTPAIAPAVVNAVFRATGRPIRKLPIRPEDLA
jgi:isoquinoline 1-oxidoreductase beta subunit